MYTIFIYDQAISANSAWPSLHEYWFRHVSYQYNLAPYQYCWHTLAKTHYADFHQNFPWGKLQTQIMKVVDINHLNISRWLQQSL